MKFLKSLNDTIARLETFLLVGFVLIMIGLSFSQVIMRNFFSGGFTWADVCLRNMVLWVGFIGASLATQQNRHITIDALTKFLSPFWKRISEVLTSLFSFGMGIVFMMASYGFVKSEYEAQGMAFLGIPFWVIQLIIPIGFGFISFRFLIKAIEDIFS
ncbi:MAG: hypothetical protein A2Z91_02070 [Deltaproteobacteria bacterium GWA2_38_16]|nr:MAG: hypothetical protein A2Z91_02070 [Deltaproteobacteria bacterium GWA2_38_16]OGQ01982.1 MAG: hypothetical protein A3D19_08365 [Deltaproteobacteria bacterium RIFCSPHIGHO2_02_FULL_38_15]OGQ33677.1 MAG: hypothetical protein A3A72_05630 [Deltaproteobacteria bacterium RIFCSPLOWO2_01_FULL_38_9]OGQ62855.1 MAG: hypothetical protein A3G92_02490 [Deltaproteobacteria bacterium RIFCSPLOWO2_12_FULL_38_8]HBQ21515.1 hypothetical protein [Deltaproteobacteria bacterium]